MADATDWRIIRELYGWQRGNYPEGALRVQVETLARRTGLHPKTIRERLRVLRARHVIDGPYLELRPDVLGLHVSAHMLEGTQHRGPQAIDAALRHAPSVQLVVFAKDFAYVVFWHSEATVEPPELVAITKALQAKSSWRSFSSLDFPAGAPPTLSALDGRIALAMRERPAMSLAMAARRLGVTTRTVERRVKRMVESGVGTTQVRFHPGRMEGTLYVHYVVRRGDARATASLAQAFPDRVVGPFGPQIRPNVGVAVENLEAAERRLEELEQMPGIEDASLYLVRDWFYPTRFDAWLATVVAERTSRVRHTQVEGQRSPNG